MKKIAHTLACTLLAFAWMRSAQATETPNANEPAQPHIDRNLMASQDGGDVKISQQPFLETQGTVVDRAPPATDPHDSLPPANSATHEDRSPPMGLLLFIFVLAIFLGFELISKVPSQLHTPLMSGSNAISGITSVGALAVAGMDTGGAFSTVLGTLAVAFAAINVVGGYLVTDRMLGMFKKKDGGPQ